MIVLRAKGVEFDVTYINLRAKPDWFLKISPHGKVPVLLVNDEPLFESNAIAEYLDEVAAPRLHPAEPFKRARNRAWTDYVPTFSGLLGGVYYAKSPDDIPDAMDKARVALARLEGAIEAERGNDGPFFNGADLSLVDASYAPFFQRFCFADAKLNTGLLAEFPRVEAWARTLLSQDVVTGSVADSFDDEFRSALGRREAHVSTLFNPSAASAAE